MPVVLRQLGPGGRSAAGRGGASFLRLVRCRFWHAVWELSDKDAQGNAAQSAAVFEDSRNCNASTDRALVALEGVDDLVVVASRTPTG